MEQYIRIYDYESIRKKVSRQPQRIKTVGFRKDWILDVFYLRTTSPPNSFCFEANNYANLVDPTLPQIFALPFDES